MAHEATLGNNFFVRILKDTKIDTINFLSVNLILIFRAYFNFKFEKKA